MAIRKKQVIVQGVRCCGLFRCPSRVCCSVVNVQVNEGIEGDKTKREKIKESKVERRIQKEGEEQQHKNEFGRCYCFC